MAQKKKWSKTGKTSLKKRQKFNLKKYAPFIAIVAVVGGFFVWRSFAGTQLYSYQYSVQKCDAIKADDTGKTTNAVNPDDSCLAKSAEALVYRMYQGALGRNPDRSGYQFYTQKLAGDRDKPTEVSNVLVKSSEFNYGQLSNEEFVTKLYQTVLNRNPDSGGLKYWKGQLDSGRRSRQFLINSFASTAKINSAQAAEKLGRPNNEDYVKQAYLGFFGRTADSGGLKYWKGQLDSGKRSRGDIVAIFAVDDSAIKNHKAGFATYLQKAPKVDIKETAKKKQEERLYISAVRVNDAKKQYDSVAGLVGYGKTRRDAAKKLAGKPVPARSDLNAIANHQKQVQSYKNRLPNVQRKITLWADRNSELYKEAKKVSDYSPDLSSDGIKSNYDKVSFYLAGANNVRKDLDNLIKDISAQYKVAEGKYEAEQRRLAEEARRKAAEEAARKKRQTPNPTSSTPSNPTPTTQPTPTTETPTPKSPSESQCDAWLDDPLKFAVELQQCW